MKHQSKITDVYKPNDKVTVTVTNKPVEDEDGGRAAYERKVTISIKAGFVPEKLVFKEEDSIAKWLETIDFEDPQQSLV